MGKNVDELIINKKYILLKYANSLKYKQKYCLKK